MIRLPFSPGPLLLPAGVLLASLLLASARRRFQRRWAPVAARYPYPTIPPSAPNPERFARTYCLIQWGKSPPFAGRFTVTTTPTGVALQPELWYTGLPTAWLPWSALATCEPTSRLLARALAPGLRLQLSDAVGWIQVDDPAGHRLYRSWRAQRGPRPRPAAG